MTQHTSVRSGPPVSRHVAAVALTAALTAGVFWLLGGEVPLSHAVLADVSVVLLCLILVLGAAARFVPRLRPVVPWGRELGIAMFVTAALHVALVAGPEVVDWFNDLFFSGIDRFNRMWVAASWLGIGALAYAVVLTATSNDWSQRLLGRSWKFLQRQVYTLFVLTWLHTSAYLFFRAGHDAQMPIWLFWAATGAAVVAQFAGFAHTVLARRPPSPHRVPPKPPADGPRNRRRTGLTWAGVAVIWAVFILGTWLLATVESAEAAEEESIRTPLCERFDELQGMPLTADIRNELEAFIPPDAPPGSLGEYLENC